MKRATLPWAIGAVFTALTVAAVSSAAAAVVNFGPQVNPTGLPSWEQGPYGLWIENICGPVNCNGGMYPGSPQFTLWGSVQGGNPGGGGYLLVGGGGDYILTPHGWYNGFNGYGTGQSTLSWGCSIQNTLVLAGGSCAGRLFPGEQQPNGGTLYYQGEQLAQGTNGTVDLSFIDGNTTVADFILDPPPLSSLAPGSSMSLTMIGGCESASGCSMMNPVAPPGVPGVPEPATLPLMVVALVTLGIVRARQVRRI